MKFRLVEENELEKRAKYHRKRQKGLSPFYSPDGGNVPLAIDRFNNSVVDGANGLMEDFPSKKKQQIISVWENIYKRLKSSSKGMIDFEFTLPNSILKTPEFWSFSEDFCEELGFSFSIDERNYQGKNCTLHGYAELEDTLEEDTVKNSDGTWSNKGDEGSHGKFRSKKKADAQRKAMFANGYRESLLTESKYDGSYGFVSLSTYKKIKKLSDKLTNLLTKYDEIIDSMESTAQTDEEWAKLENNTTYKTLIRTYQNNYEVINLLSDMFKNNLIQVGEYPYGDDVTIDLNIYNISDLQNLYNDLENTLKSITNTYKEDWNIKYRNDLDTDFGYDPGPGYLLVNHPKAYPMDKSTAKSIARNLSKNAPDFMSYWAEEEDFEDPYYDDEESFDESLNESGRYRRFNPLKELVIDVLDFLWENDYPFSKDEYLADSWYDWKEGVEMGIDDYFETAQILEDYLSDYAFNKDAAYFHDTLSDYIGKQIRANSNGGIWESLTEDVIPNKEINYIGFFVNNNDIDRVLKSISAKSLEKKILVPHVTTKYKPEEIDTSLFGKTIDIIINGYGKNDTNEGFRVELKTDDPDLQDQINNIAKEGSIPHITTSISADGKAVNTRYLDFKDIKPITIKGTFGGFTKNNGVITSLKESLFLEKQGDSAKLDQRSKKYIADPAANAINSLLGLEKRGKGRFGSKNSSNSRQGGNGSWNEKTVIKIGGRNFEIMCKKYGFLQKDYNIHNVLREASAKGIKLGDLAWRIKNEGSTNKSVKWIANAIMKFISKNESLTEAWFTPLSEVSSFTGWMDDDNLIDEEERFNSKLERVLKTNRNDIQVLIDSDFEYDPRTYDIEDMTQLQEVKTKNIHANKFLVNGIEFVFEDASSSSSPRLYFKSEEDGEAYTNYIDHYYDEEM